MSDGFTPNKDEIKAVVVVDLRGHSQTYSDLLSAMTAVFNLPPTAVQSIEAVIEEAQTIKDR